MSGRHYGGNSMTAPLRRVAMTRPGPALAEADPATWHYGEGFDPERIGSDHQGLVDIVTAAGAEIDWTTAAAVEQGGLADAVFAYDPSFMTDEGAIILSMGKSLRRPERAVHEALYRDLEIPVIGTIEPPGTVEGGDCFWIGASTLAVGRGFRTNQAGIDQLAEILAPQAVTVRAYDLAYYHGPEACLHLMSIVSPLSPTKALVYAPLLPTALYEDLVKAGYELVTAPEEEFVASGGLSLNVLALAPDDVAMISGFNATAKAISTSGSRVQTFDGSSLCIPCEGGPTCLTRPILRN